MADTSGFTVKSSSKKAPNVSSGWVVMVLSGLIAVVIFFYVTAQGGSHTEVLVASHDINPGDKIKAGDFHSAQVNVDQTQLSRLIGAKDQAGFTGYIAVGPIKSGDLVLKTSLQPSSGKDGLRTISIALDKTHAANGNIQVGDHIDIINEGKDNNTSPNYEAVDREVTAVSSESSGGLSSGGSSNFVLSVSVTSDEALNLSEAIKFGKIDVVRATGAPTFVGNVPAPPSGSGNPVLATSTGGGTTTTTTAPK